MPLKRQTTANGKCKAKTKAGRSCAAPAVRGSAFCALHSDPNRAAELGRKGGARNRKVCDGDVRDVSVPESAGDVKRMLAETMADTRAGKIDPKLGSTLGYLGMSLLRAFEVADLEQRVERLEQKHELENQDRWPTTEVIEPDGTHRFVLKDGTEISRVEPTPVYSYQSRELVGFLEGDPPKFRAISITASERGDWEELS